MQGDGVEIAAWEYLGPDAVAVSPDVSEIVRAFGDRIRSVWLVQHADGFDLVWGEVRCATQPVVIVQADMTIEFWPGGIVGEDCEAAEVYHKLTVTLETDVPFDQWTVTLHPPPPVEA